MVEAEDVEQKIGNGEKIDEIEFDVVKMNGIVDDDDEIKEN